MAVAGLLAGAGFDAMAIANDHAGDAGPSTVIDTVSALRSVGIEPIGGGGDLAAASAPMLRDVHGVRIAVLAFDLTLGGPAAGVGPGIARWDPADAEAAVRARSAHLGVFDATTTRLLWGAGTMVRPIGTLAGCDGAIAVAFTTLDDDAVTGGGAWTWRGFGFATATELDGQVTPACTDVDGDGRTEPVLLDRTAITTRGTGS